MMKVVNKENKRGFRFLIEDVLLQVLIDIDDKGGKNVDNVRIQTMLNSETVNKNEL